jgi:hypothetical protein
MLRIQERDQRYVAIGTYGLPDPLLIMEIAKVEATLRVMLRPALHHSVMDSQSSIAVRYRILEGVAPVRSTDAAVETYLGCVHKKTSLGVIPTRGSQFRLSHSTNYNVSQGVSHG